MGNTLMKKEDKYRRQFFGMLKKNKKAKSEIERLKEINAVLALANLCDLPPNEDCLTDNEFEAARKMIAEQKAEIERLTEELKNCGQDLIDSHREQEELQDRNAELQKQVDELKTKIELEKEWGDIKVAQALVDFKTWKQQTIKDTAKEILQELWDETEPLNESHKWMRLRIKNIASRKGVEVE